MAGLTDQGLVIKRLTDIREDLRKEASRIFNDLVTEGEILDTSSASTLGRLIGVVTPAEADLWEAIQQVYSAFDPSSATGIALDNLVAFSGIVRKGATKSSARVLLRGDYNTLIPSGSIVSSSYTNNRFTLPVDVKLDTTAAIGFILQVQAVQNSTEYVINYSNGTNEVALTYTSTSGATEAEILDGLSAAVNDNYGSILTATVVGSTLEVTSDDLVTQTNYGISGNLFFTKIVKGLTVVCTEFGPIEQAPETIDTISTPVFGWDSVTQFETASVGSLRETDSQLRTRFDGTKYTVGSNIVDALYSDLITLDGVKNVTIYENVTSVVDSKGIPPHAFMVLIRGGLEQEISEAIWRNRPAGISTHGNSVFLITDIFGNRKEVYFQRPSYADIYVTVDLTVDADFPPDGSEQIRTALFDYIYKNSVVGEPITYSRLYTPLNSIPGHQVDSLKIGLTANPTGTSNIPVAYDELAKLEVGNIKVNVT